MIQFRDRVKEFSESGHLETQIMIENQLINDLKTKLISIDPKDHMEFISVRGQLKSLQVLQSRREDLIGDEED